ncbi:MAG: HYR domain-containing protein [Saprospiraceae bacterium]|nr:HYR domain-containing protein [Saprospiraceae bacterium]
MTNKYQSISKLVVFATLFSCLTQSVNAQTRQKYRTFDGTYNNLSFTQWGAANIPLFRELPAEYGSSDPKNALGGTNRPTPRAISNKLSDEPQDIQNARDMSGLFYIWGQFLDHDITLSPTARNESAPIALPSDEPKFTNPISFFRSAIHPGTGITTPREQTNVATSWIDASQVYGSDPQTAAWLRTFSYGKLKVSAGNMLPFNTYSGEYDSPLDLNAPKMDDDNNRTKKTFAAGDPRAAEHPGLTSLHTLFVREHNRICDRLRSQGMTNDEEIYQKARKEIGALLQVITYGQWISSLGVQLKSYAGYNPSVRPDIMNTFSTAAYRWHTMVENDIIFRDNDCHGFGPVELPLSNVFFNIGIVRKYDIGVLLKGLSVHQQYETDLKVNNGLRNSLFGSGSGLDLVSINLQRGRDHGLPNYNAIRQYYTGSPAYTFYDITGESSNSSKMQSLYGNVNNVDLWAGLFGEPHLAGKSVGKTLDAIIRAQFEKLRDGDYYFYMNDPELAADRSRIQTTTLADIIARNTNAGNFQTNVFFRKHCNANGDDIANFGCNVTPNFEGWTFLGQQGASTYFKWQGITPVNYADAKLMAESIGGYLPRVTNATQNAYIASKLGGASIWLDLVRSGLTWKYSDATNVSYYNWATGEPNNAGGIESCAQMKADGKWNDITGTATQTLIVEVPYEDIAAPTFTSCPKNITVASGLLNICKPVSWTVPTAADNCSLMSMTQTSGPANGSCLIWGSYNVGYTATDAKGNKGTCNFTVSVVKTLSLFAETQESLALNAHAEPTRTQLEWVSNTGFKSDYFALEKANNTTGEFELLNIQNNKSNDNSPTYYSFYDNAPTEGDNTYRVTVVYQDGTKKVSASQTVVFKGLLDVRVFPNPANDVLSIDLSNYKDQAVEVYLYNSLGQPKHVSRLDRVNNPILELNTSNEPVGNYMIRIKSKGRRDVTKTVVITH